MSLQLKSSVSQVGSKGRALTLPSRPAFRTSRSRSTRSVEVKALFSKDSEGQDKKKFLSREEEPDEYWVSKSEKAGANPFKDPIALVGILAIFFPFIFLLIAIATGAVDTSVYR